jgi:hypothetical protein
VAVEMNAVGGGVAPRSARSDSAGPADSEAIAHRVAALLAEGLELPHYLDTGAVARMLGVSVHWVREHAAELGASRLGDGPRGPLRFDLELVRAAMERRRVGATRRQPQRKRSGRARTGGVELVAFRDRGAR